MFVTTSIPEAPPDVAAPVPLLPVDPDVVGTLRSARQRIADVERWTDKAEARSADGRCVEVSDPEAVSWCALGAVMASAHARHVSEREAIAALSRATSYMSVIDYNDHPPTILAMLPTRWMRALQHRRVLRLFDKAIAQA